MRVLQGAQYKWLSSLVANAGALLEHDSYCARAGHCNQDTLPLRNLQAPRLLHTLCAVMDAVRHLMPVVLFAKLLPHCLSKQSDLLTTGVQRHREIFLTASMARGHHLQRDQQ